jgi:hypothetical protein
MAEILTEWREAERLLDELPPLSRDHETVRLVVNNLRIAYARMADSQELSQDALESNRHVLTEARALLELVDSRVSQPRGSSQLDRRRAS